jgi:hypothetical protein
MKFRKELYLPKIAFFFLLLLFFVFVLFLNFIIHMCIQGLGDFSPRPYPLSYHPLRPLPLPPPPQYPAETILPLFLILL